MEFVKLFGMKKDNKLTKNYEDSLLLLGNLLTSTQSELENTQHHVHSLEAENRWLKEQIKQSKQRHYGHQTETTESLQLSLPIFDKNEGDEAQVKSGEENETITYTRRKKQKGRQLDTTQLPRERVYHDIAEEEKQCDCGCQKALMKEEIREQIDYIPASLKVIEHVIPTYRCRRCDTLQSGKKPESAIPKCMATHRFISHIMLDKYQRHLPFYRQSKIFASQQLLIPDNTLGNWAMGAARVLAPLGDALWQQITNIHGLQADETKIRLLKPNQNGYVWAYHSLDPDNRFIRFEFRLGRDQSCPNQRLTHFRGILQTDGYSGYNFQRERNDIIHIGCWDHARRKVVETIKICDAGKEGAAGELLLPINELYRIERQTKTMTDKARQTFREENANPLLDQIYEKAQSIRAPPKSYLGQAVTYLLNQWPTLIEYIKHGNMPISNILIENQMRPLKLGAKNWLFVGNEQSANRGMLSYSLIQTCLMNEINPGPYLIYVLDHAQAMRRGEVDPSSLLPQFIDRKLLQS